MVGNVNIDIMMNDEIFTNVNLHLKEQFQDFNEQNVSGILIKKLSNSDVPIKNKNKENNNNNKNSEITITTQARNFFTEYIGKSYMENKLTIARGSDSFLLPIKVESIYSETESSQEFVDTNTCIWRKNKNKKGHEMQIGISKTELDGDVFKRCRERMHVGDYILFIKTSNKLTSSYDNTLYVILAKKDTEFWNKIDGGYKNGRINVHEKIPATVYFEGESEKQEFLTTGDSIIYYGIPGTGKSHDIQKDLDERYTFRVVFHEDFTYRDFIGGIQPVLKKVDNSDESSENKVVYEFIPGEFATCLKSALENPTIKHTLVIEELNRANAASVFGDIFQLLDRKHGKSIYKINNNQLASYIYKDCNNPLVEQQLGISINKGEVKLPGNFFFVATMNTSDQNIQAIDSAFTRRWDETKYVRSDFSKLKEDAIIGGLDVKWSDFAKIVNNLILDNLRGANNEDKQLGPFFAKNNVLSDKEKFANKVLVYLFRDVFKRNGELLFNVEIVNGIESLIDTYLGDNPLKVFNEDVRGMIEAFKNSNKSDDKK